MRLLAILLIVVAGEPVPQPYLDDPLAILEPRAQGSESGEVEVEQQAFAQPREVWMDSVEEWRPLVAGHFAPDEVERVLCLMEFESQGNPSAQNPSGASGLMQIMPMWASEYGVSRTDLFVPEINLYIAKRLLDAYGWDQWSPYNRGECR